MPVPASTGSAVVLTNPEPFDPVSVARTLAEIDKQPYLDIIPHIRRGWGVLREGLEASAAADLCQQLSQAGLGVAVVPAERVVVPRPAKDVKGFRAESDGFSFVPPPNGERKQVPWPYLELVAVGALRSSSSRTVREKQGPSVGAKLAATGLMLATGLPIPIGRTKVVERKIETVDYEFVLDVFVRGSHLRMRVDPTTLDYSFLGDRKSLGRMDNFRTLMADFGRLAPQALKNKGVHGVLAGKPASAIGYENEGELDRECRWLLTAGSISAGAGA